MTILRNGQIEAMSLPEYLHIHSQRECSLNHLTKLNGRPGRYHESLKVEIKQIKEIEHRDSNKKKKRMLYQRSLGMFRRIEVSNGKVTCNCENFRRFGICDDSKLIGLICLGSNGYPTETSEVSYQIKQQGYDNIAKKRREELLSKLEEITDDMIEKEISPPLYDPMEIVCDVKEW